MLLYAFPRAQKAARQRKHESATYSFHRLFDRDRIWLRLLVRTLLTAALADVELAHDVSLVMEKLPNFITINQQAKKNLPKGQVPVLYVG